MENIVIENIFSIDLKYLLASIVLYLVITFVHVPLHELGHWVAAKLVKSEVGIIFFRKKRECFFKIFGIKIKKSKYYTPQKASTISRADNAFKIYFITMGGFVVELVCFAIVLLDVELICRGLYGVVIPITNTILIFIYVCKILYRVGMEKQSDEYKLFFAPIFALVQKKKYIDIINEITSENDIKISEEERQKLFLDWNF